MSNKYGIGAFTTSHLGKAGPSCSENPPVLMGTAVTKTRKTMSVGKDLPGKPCVLFPYCERSPPLLILSSQGIVSSLSSDPHEQVFNLPF